MTSEQVQAYFNKQFPRLLQVQQNCLNSYYPTDGQRSLHALKIDGVIICGMVPSGVSTDDKFPVLSSELFQNIRLTKNAFLFLTLAAALTKLWADVGLRGYEHFSDEDLNGMKTEDYAQKLSNLHVRLQNVYRKTEEGERIEGLLELIF